MAVLLTSDNAQYKPVVRSMTRLRHGVIDMITSLITDSFFLFDEMKGSKRPKISSTQAPLPLMVSASHLSSTLRYDRKKPENEII